ncbi:prepilin-type N-terminal cleavage/methylation domain-containing protein [Deinococcus psychrotolerans]|uniref:Prepilin-type N-terminal cleavage/methylation domain-containing protein n=1 Tax=Deinococcus psychrotolerans TaxID=2489213 RepID=A0A3G8YST8_9DEIO|nr:prepilin-type N-terminal cleavage/methylation domain-containing protein [Deinococcus psychrotolerans]AZI44306.1 prepilin-type N-terminal cleavage/methylation domain-containing protein [Deinococcus psychrotolerans]
MPNLLPPTAHHRAGFTLVELLVTLALTVLIVSALATILPRSMALSRTDTLTAATNTVLTNVVGTLNASFDRSRPIILLRASRTQLEFLQLGEPQHIQTLDGTPTQGQDTFNMPILSTNPVGVEYVFLNTAGDYLLSTVKSYQSSDQTLSFACAMNLPGQVQAYTYTRVRYTFASPVFSRTEKLSNFAGSAGISDPESVKAQNVQFAPVYGQTLGDFGITFQPPLASIMVAGRSQPMTGLNYAITALGSGLSVTNAGSVRVRLAGKTQWACGQKAGIPPNSTGTLQVNTMLEHDPKALGNPRVDVVGATSTQSITTFAKSLFPDLMPGQYNASAAPLDMNGTSYDPHITGSPATIGDGSNATINVDYQEATGTLQIIEDGLPAGRSAQIDGTKLYSAVPTIRGKKAYLTALVSQLLPGTYTLTSFSKDITVNGQTFTATPISVTITARKLTTVHVQWQPATGTALIHIQGLPANQSATFQFYGRSPYFLKDFTSPNGDVTIGQILQGNYDLFAFKTTNGYVATISWQLGSKSGSDLGENGARLPIGPGQTTLVTVNYALPSSGPPSGGADSFLVWGAIGRTLPTAVVYLRPGLEDHQNPSPAPMTAYVMSNLDAVRVAAGWYTILVTDSANGTILYRTVTYIGKTPAFSLTTTGPEYTIQSAPMPYLDTLYVGDSATGNLVFYATNEINRPLKTTITTPNDRVVHTNFDQSLLQYVGSFGVSDGPTGILWQLQNQGLNVDYENYQPIKDNINNSVQSPVTQHDFCSRTKTGTTFQDCISDYARYGKWW